MDRTFLAPVRGGRTLRIRNVDGIHPLDPYAPAFAARFLIRAGETAWDLGCGAGLYGCAAAAMGASRVLMSDIDGAAVSCALENARRNGLDGVTGRTGSLLAPARGERFDLIMTSVPQLPAPGPVISTRYGGCDGLEFFRPLAAGAAAHLRPGGRLYALVTDWADTSQVAPLFQHRGFRVRIALRVERAYQPVEYDRMRPGLFRFLQARSGAIQRSGSWCYLGVSLLEARRR